MLGLVGPNGCGKSTLLQLLGALDQPTRGDVRIAGDPIAGRDDEALSALRNRSIGFVFQFHHLLPDLTATENVALPLFISRFAWRESREQAIEALQSMKLGERTRHPVSHLSGGEQQRVALARALVKRPRLVLADEPTGNLDAKTGDEIATLLNSYCRRERAIIIIATHNARLAETCDRILILEDGRIVERQK